MEMDGAFWTTHFREKLQIGVYGFIRALHLWDKKGFTRVERNKNQKHTREDPEIGSYSKWAF